MSEFFIPFTIVQITSVLVPAGPNNGDYVLHTALDSAGGLWQMYQSHGFSNVPDDGLWRLLEPKAVRPTDA
jgi:hypothetical protein